MIFFVGNGGTIVKGLTEPVYQGAANANTVYLVAPFASNGTVTVAFQLPNGTATAPAQMTAQGEISGITDENGAAYSGWLYDLPNAVTALYGVVTAQFYFYNAQGKITASSATSFTVGRGVPAVLPDEPSEDVYEQILSNIAALQTDLNNGFYAARAIYAWNSTYTYGANEITYYPVGSYGAFVKSVQANNTGNTPYVDGAINSAYWEEVLNFDAAIAAAETAQAAAEAAQVAAEAAEDSAQGYANAAQGSAQTAEAAQEQAEGYAEAAEGSASAAAGSASEAAASAASAQNSADLAQGYMEQAKDYAKKEYKVYNSFDDLPIPGDSAFIYLVPSSGGASNDSYSEYLWISEDNKYEYIGSVNDVDLSNYAQINGNYQGMTVGAATKATQDGAGNVITDTYATKAENASKYTKPADGIPESDLTESVQEKLNASSGGIVLVDALPAASEEEYNKHLLYLQGTKLSYIAAEVPDNPTVNVVANLPAARVCSGAAAVGSDIYIFGGQSTHSTSTDTNTIFKFDSVSKTATKLSTTLSHDAAGSLVVAIEENIYILSGITGGYAEKFDSVTQTCTNLGLFNWSSYNSGAAVGTDVYRFGGGSGTAISNYVKTISKFDSISETRTTLSVTLPEVRAATSAAAVGTNIFIFGGRQDTDERDTSTVNDILKFDTVTQTLTTLEATLFEKTSETSAVAIGTNVYIFGGHGAGDTGGYYQNYIQKFDSVSETCTKLNETLPTVRYGTSAAAVGTNAYVFGGFSYAEGSFASLAEIVEVGFGYVYSYKQILTTGDITYA